MILLPIRHARSQPVLGSRPAALGSASVALPDDAWQSWNNPALLDTEHHKAAFFGMRSFGLSELTDMAATLQYPINIWGTGVGLGTGLHRFGYPKYNVTHFRISGAWHNQKLYLGTGLTWHYVNIQRYGSAGAFTLQLGLAIHPTEHFWIGSSVENPTGNKLGNSNTELPRRLHLGFSWQMNPRLLYTAEVYKEDHFDPGIRTGAEATLWQGLHIRAGFRSLTQSLSFGLGYDAAFGAINLAARRHPTLGWSPALDIQVTW